MNTIKTLIISCGLISFSLSAVTSCTKAGEEQPTVKVENIAIDKMTVTLVTGEKLQLSATVTPADATDSSISWETSDPNIVTVDDQGNITAVSKGSATVFAVNETIYASCKILVNNQPQPGDYYYSDGTYSTEFNTGKKCIGIIYYAGQHPNDKSDYSSTGIGKEKCHGYAVALEDADGMFVWGQELEALGFYPTDENGNPIDNFSKNSNDLEWSGYYYTMKIKEDGEKMGTFTEEKLKGYAAAYYAVNFHIAAPEHSSGWFLPASSQLYAIHKSGDILDGVVSGRFTQDYWYWSSSEYYELPERVALFFNGVYKRIEGRSKSSTGMYVRPVIAF